MLHIFYRKIRNINQFYANTQITLSEIHINRFFFSMQKEDPLKRIQEEINEVARRERELRQKAGLLENGNGGGGTAATEGDPSSSAMSDDSGISSSSSPIHGMSSNVKESASLINSLSDESNAATAKIQYKRSHTIHPTTSSSSATYNQNSHMMPIQKLTRTMSTPQIFMPASKRFNVNGGQKGLMQRFIASRGKFSPAKPKDSILVSKFFLNYFLSCEFSNFHRSQHFHKL